MTQCKWSQNNLCQVMVLKNTDTKVTCDGHHAACLPSRRLNLEDIRFRQPIAFKEDYPGGHQHPKLSAPSKKPGWGESEESIYEALGLPYQVPEERS